MDIQETITVFENEPDIKYQSYPTKIFLLIIQAMVMALLLQHQSYGNK